MKTMNRRGFFTSLAGLLAAGAASKTAASGHVSVKDDIPAALPNGVFILKKSSEESFGADFADKLQKQVQELVKKELVSQSRSDGFFAQKNRYKPTI